MTPAAPSAFAQAERRWIVDSRVTASGDGSAEAPFATLADAVQAATGVIVVRGAGPYAGGITLRGGQSLVGEDGAVIGAASGAVLTIADTSAPVSITNVKLQATDGASGIVIRDVRDVITLRNVDVAISARGQLANGIVVQKATGGVSVEGGTIEGASARAISVIDSSHVTLRKLQVLKSASVNGVAPVECGGNLAAGSNERCHAAVYLHNAENVTLDEVVIDGSGQAGVVAHQVNDLTVTGSTIRNAGDETFEHAFVLEELGGQCRIANTKIARSASRHVMLHNSAGKLAFVFEKNVLQDTIAPNGQQGVLISAAGEANVDVRVVDSTFARTFSHALDITASDNAKVALRVTGSTFEKNASAVSISATHAATIDYLIADNPSITGSTAAAINVFVGSPSSGTVSGTIARNVIGRSGDAKSGAACSSCSGIRLAATGNGRLVAAVDGNIIQQTGGSAIQATASEGAPQLSVIASANLLREGNDATPAIRIQSGALPDDAAYVCADLGGSGARANKIEGAWDAAGAIHLIHRLGNTRFLVAGLVDANSDVAAAEAAAARNGNVKVRAVLRADSMKRGFEPVERCTMPALEP